MRAAFLTTAERSIKYMQTTPNSTPVTYLRTVPHVLSQDQITSKASGSSSTEAVAVSPF